jgi:hypothetical protein
LDKFLVSEVSDPYYAVAEGRNSGSFGMYVDVGKFLSEVDGVVGTLLKLFPTYPEVRLYLEVHQGWGQRDPPSTHTGRLWVEGGHGSSSPVGRGK